MRIYIIIFILFIAEFSCAQFVQGDWVRKENSRKAADFARQNIGNKIGNGICYEFVEEAVKRNRPKDYNFILYKNSDPFLIKDRKNVIPGDVVVFENVVIVYRRDTISNHTGIVLQMDSDGFAFLHQNTFHAGDEVKKIYIDGHEYNVSDSSSVEIEYFSYESIVSGKLLFYRY